jgi:hypothetical protein
MVYIAYVTKVSVSLCVFVRRPKINKDPLTDEEYEIILNEQARIGNKWIDIAKIFLEVRIIWRTWF